MKYTRQLKSDARSAASLAHPKQGWLNTLWLTLGIVLVTALVGCAGGPPKNIELAGSLTATNSINPNRNGRASPVTVVIFHLKNAEAFETRDFFNLYDADSGVLGDDVVQRTDIQISPGQTQPVISEFAPETKYVGVIAGFREIDQASWRAVVPVPDKKTSSKSALVVTVDRLSVSASVLKR